jgi:hypothetical protein
LSRSAVRLFAIFFRSAALVAVGRSGTLARLGNFLPSPGAFAGALASLAAFDSGLSLP